MSTFELDKCNSKINIDNALISAAQGLLLSEKRIIMLAITKLSNQISDIPIKIEALEYSKLYNLDPKTAYEQIKDTCEGIIKKQVQWYEETMKGKQKIQMNWISFALYAPGEGFIEISFTSEIKKYLLHLKKHFTTYQLEQARALRSIYSWRLLELLSQFKTTGWREIDLTHFSNLMEATEKQKKDFSKIRTKIIEPSIKELKEKDGWHIEWEPIKKGRKIHSVLFVFNKTE